MATETLDVGCTNSTRSGGESLGVLEQFSGWLIQSSGPPVDREPVHDLLVVDLVPEVVQMGNYSVVALV